MLWEIREIVNGSISPVNRKRKWLVVESATRVPVIAGRSVLPSAFVLFEHVLNGGLVNHQIRSAIVADYFDAGLVVPLDDSVHFFAVAQHNHHRRSRLHLFLVIEILGVGLFWRRSLSTTTRCSRTTVRAL